MKKVWAALMGVLLLFGVSSANAAFRLLNGSWCGISFGVPSSGPATGPFLHGCPLGSMPLGTGFNAVVAVLQMPETHKVECWMEILWGVAPVAKPIPQGYSSNKVTFWPTGAPRSVALTYSWLPDQYAGFDAYFSCREDQDPVNPRTLKIAGFYLIR